MDNLNAFRVGGYVRDTLLGREPQDCDWVVVGHTPDELLDRGFTPVGREFPVFLHPQTRQEYALARTERKVAPGYTGFEFDVSPHVTLEADLARRDFTINAMAMEANDRVVDPFGGRADLEARVLRHVSPAFAEDPVRILRAARFAARYDFDIAPETGRLMRDMVDAGEVDALTAERVWTELWKALGERQPSRFVRELHDCGALARLFPELAALDGVPQVARHHPEVDTLVHVLMALDQATRLSADPLVRFAVLVHDLGKGVTPSDVLPAHHGHEAAGLPLVEALCARYRAPKACLQLGTIVSAHHLRAHRALELQPKKVVGLFEQIDAFRRPERLDAFLLACEADARGRLGLEDRAYPQALYLRECFAAARSVSAHEVAGPGVTGARIGELVHAARVHTVKDIKTRWQSDPAVMDRMD